MKKIKTQKALRAAALALMLAACDHCGPTHDDYVGCAASCGTRGVQSVTFTKCECGAPSQVGRPQAPLNETLTPETR